MPCDDGAADSSPARSTATACHGVEGAPFATVVPEAVRSRHGRDGVTKGVAATQHAEYMLVRLVSENALPSRHGKAAQQERKW